MRLQGNHFSRLGGLDNLSAGTGQSARWKSAEKLCNPEYRSRLAKGKRETDLPEEQGPHPKAAGPEAGHPLGRDKGSSRRRRECACAPKRACARRSVPLPEAWRERDQGGEPPRGASQEAWECREVGRSRAPTGGRRGRRQGRPRCPPLLRRGSRFHCSRLRRPPASGTRPLAGARARNHRHPPAPALAATPLPPPTFCRRSHRHLLLHCPLLSSPSVDCQVSAEAPNLRLRPPVCTSPRRRPSPQEWV